jgi:hypothetical protein
VTLASLLRGGNRRARGLPDVTRGGLGRLNCQGADQRHAENSQNGLSHFGLH